MKKSTLVGVCVAVIIGAVFGALGYRFIFATPAPAVTLLSSIPIAGDIAPVSTTSSIIIGTSSTSSTSTSSVSTPLAVDMSTWKTYTNYELGFSIQYPADLTVDTSNLSAVALNFPASYFSSQGETASVSVEISATCNVVPSQEIDLNGISFSKNTTNSQTGAIDYYSNNNGVCYTLSYVSDQADDAANVDDIANSMLSTFTFITTPAGENEADYSAGQSVQSTDSNSGTIEISNISSTTISVGANLVLTGFGFSGSTSTVSISNGSVQGVLWAGIASSDSSIEVTVPAQVCTQYVEVSGSACPSYLIINPGVYTIGVTNQNGTTDPVYIKVQ